MTSPPAPAAAPAQPRKPTLLWVALAVVGMLLAATVGAALGTLRSRALSSAAVGDCLAERGRSYRRVDCAAEGADFRLFGVTGQISACGDVLGASRALETGGRAYCIGDKHADPSTAVNGVEAGDCVRVSGQDAHRSGCTRGSYPVLAVLRNELKSGGSSDLSAQCRDAPGTTQVYGWTLTTPGSPVGTWSRVLCLGPRKS